MIGEVDEIPDKEFKRMVIIMNNEMKKDMNRCLDKFQEYTNKQSK
jgi:hypothetical protein